MRSRRSLLIVLVAVLLMLGIIGRVVPHVEHYELSRRLDGLVLHATAPGGSGIVDLAQLDLFAWDALYLFRPYTSDATIDAALGFAWDARDAVAIERRDDINLLVFTRGRSVAGYLEPPRSKLDFAGVADHLAFTPAAAQFQARTVSGSQVVLLTPVAP